MSVDSSDPFSRVYLEHAQGLRVHARRKQGYDECQDLVQEAFLRLWVYARHLSLRNPGAYLRSVITHLVFDAHRDRSRFGSLRDDLPSDQTPPEDVSHHPEPERIVASREQLEICLRALDELPEICRHVFLLNRVDGLTQNQIADELGLSVRTVERYVARALAHCQRRMEVELG